MLIWTRFAGKRLFVLNFIYNWNFTTIFWWVKIQIFICILAQWKWITIHAKLVAVKVIQHNDFLWHRHQLAAAEGAGLQPLWQTHWRLHPHTPKCPFCCYSFQVAVAMNSHTRHYTSSLCMHVLISVFTKLYIWNSCLYVHQVTLSWLPR